MLSQTDTAVQEADFILDLIKDYPICIRYLRLEASVMYSTLTPAQLRTLLMLQKLKKLGYYIRGFLRQ